ncbi:MAG: hypothetical protein WC144_07505 [Sulfurimonas sp.]|jgi:hypothetical protein|nr:hypothetical protein [Sulfurimonadaceae bacterium]
MREKLKEALKKQKPTRSIWGFLGVLLFFILPEFIAYFWGVDIVTFAQTSGADEPINKALIYLFEDGVSYINLAIGFALLVWLFI